MPNWHSQIQLAKLAKSTEQYSVEIQTVHQVDAILTEKTDRISNVNTESLNLIIMSKVVHAMHVYELSQFVQRRNSF